VKGPSPQTFSSALPRVASASWLLVGAAILHLTFVIVPPFLVVLILLKNQSQPQASP